MFGPQRPAAPWSFGNFWGQYDTYADLPNVAGSSLQLPTDVQAGDIAWVRDPGALYVCYVPTQGAAIWAEITAGLPPSTQFDFYVAPNAANASDANPGTLAEPLATLDEAKRRVTPVCRYNQSPVIIHLESASYTWTETLENLPLGAPLVIVCDGAGQAGDDGFVEILPSTVAAALSTQFLVDVTGGGLTVDALVGDTIEILTGAAAGDRRTISANSASTITPTSRFTAAVAPGDTFRVVRSGATITTPTNRSAFGNPLPMISGVGVGGDIEGVATFNYGPGVSNPSMLLLVNLTFLPPAGSNPEVAIFRSFVAMAGVSFVQGATLYKLAADDQTVLQAGFDRQFLAFTEFLMPLALGLAPNATAWTGWGLDVQTANLIVAPQVLVKHLLGFIAFQGPTQWVIPGVAWRLFGGRFRATAPATDNGFLFVSEGSQLVIRALEAALPVIISAEGGENRAACLRAVGGSVVSIHNVRFEMTTNGVCVVAHGDETSLHPFLQAGTISLITGVTFLIDANVRGCAVAQTGGRIYWDANPTVSGGPPTVGQAYLTQSATGGAPVAPSPTTFAALGDGVVVANPDLSGTLVGKIT